MARLAGKVAIVTGAAQGIGRAIVARSATQVLQDLLEDAAIMIVPHRHVE